MSIELDPPELAFKRPFNREVCQVLHLNNKNQESVVFKVKTTAPKHYCVRPNSGRIEPGKHVDVQVLLQAMKEEPAPDAKCKDKFLVQSVLVSPDLEYANVTSIFEKTPKASVQERKIRVSWLSAEEGAAGEGDTNGLPDEEPPAYTSPTATYETPAVSKKGTDEASPIPPPDFGRKSKAPQEDASSSAKATTGIAVSSDNLQSQLTAANSQIAKLKDRLADQGLRQRKTGGDSAPAAAPMMQQQHSQSSEMGVPLQIVAGLCLISFLIGYFFF